VVFVRKYTRFIIFEAIDKEFEHHPGGPNTPHVGWEYFQLGIDQDRKPVWNKLKVSNYCSMLKF
jgi:hypothetical protein